ncbi:hypothetical protein G9A89_021175 [Geosiphon pyriformis]|nr:hypothetical protein G9A89_021175 [Geosiphon pyriformis]
MFHLLDFQGKEDRSTLNHLTPSELDAFYAALRIWNEIVEDSANEFWTQLVPGRVVVFDNWRVLHGRTGFTGYRRLCGAYLNWDDYQSQLRCTLGRMRRVKKDGDNWKDEFWTDFVRSQIGDDNRRIIVIIIVYFQLNHKGFKNPRY